jgi:MFS family permease
VSASAPLGRSYWRLWSAHTISNLGDGISSVAYPWLASAVTRSPFLIALIAILSRLPWLIFTLPAGALTDRYDRRRIIVLMDVVRGLITAGVAIVVTFNATSLPDLNTVGQSTQVSTNMPIYVALAIAALLMGFAEVLRDNSAQTLLPSVVSEENLESANGKLWSTEYLMNSFIGPPVGSFLLGIAVFLPLYIDAGTFFVAAALIATLATAKKPQSPALQKNMRKEVSEGFSWLWSNELLRSMAIALGALNFIGMMANATFILFAQEVLHTSVFEFAILGTAGALGGTLAGFLAPKVIKKIGSGKSLALALVTIPMVNLLIGISNVWIGVWVLTFVLTSMAVLWNVVTVTFRQSVVPSELLGRVNSVYRFFGWGSIPIGALVGGSLVTLLSQMMDREWALRSPYFLATFLGLVAFFFAAPRLTTAKIEAARAQTQK